MPFQLWPFKNTPPMANLAYHICHNNTIKNHMNKVALQVASLLLSVCGPPPFSLNHICGPTLPSLFYSSPIFILPLKYKPLNAIKSNIPTYLGNSKFSNVRALWLVHYSIILVFHGGPGKLKGHLCVSLRAFSPMDLVDIHHIFTIFLSLCHIIDLVNIIGLSLTKKSYT